ncbi:ornithine cyclodeaminase family protein [Streptomyces broussonetiae]|uniref:ornithine cyclodeaminase family protein n=1 Tax=Streptomyces broussonetiae TaxID=2686304 RepID=UPI0035D81808
MLKLLDAPTVRQVLSVDELASRIGDVFTQPGGGAGDFARTAVHTGEGDLLVMPAVYASTLSVKLITLFDGARARGLPTVQGLVAVFDSRSGAPTALIDATALTELRTAAVTALATGVLARKDARTLAVIGAGTQARGHLEGLAPLRPWHEVRLHSRDARRAHRLAEWAAGIGPGLDVRVCGSVEAAVSGADVICTVTSSPEPLFADSAVAPHGVHISAVGAYGRERRELPSALVARSTLFVESAQAVLREAGDLLIPIAEGALPKAPALVELAELLGGGHPGRRDEGETTLFKSVGIPAEDAFTCDLLYHRAVEQGAGTDIGFGPSAP